jgi:hypothetical protein
LGPLKYTSAKINFVLSYDKEGRYKVISHYSHFKQKEGSLGIQMKALKKMSLRRETEIEEK